MSEMTNYVADAITEALRQEGSSDFVLSQTDTEIVYVSVESGKFFLVTVQEAEAKVAQ